jgi:putative transposase
MADNSDMARQPRSLQVLPGHPHHLILRGNNRRRLFSYPSEHRLFLFRLSEASEKQGVPVHTTTQMSNHVHLVVTPRESVQLARFVQCFAQAYAQFRNRRRRASGKLFEERYRSIPITTEEQMAVTTAYVELNPVRAGVCAGASAYRWSTFRVHAGLDAGDPLINRLWTPSSWYLSLGANPSERAAAYVGWFDYYRARDDWSEVYGDPKPPEDRKRFETPARRSAI